MPHVYLVFLLLLECNLLLSPRWLAKVGRLDDARKVIGSLWGASEVEKPMEEIKSVVVNDDLQASWSELLVEPHNRVALIGGSLFFLQQFAGINGVLYFSSLTFRDVGITSGILASLYVGIINFGGAIGASNLMDKQGRKKLLIGSYLGLAIALFLIVYAISFPLDGGVKHSLSITGTLLYIFTFALGAGPVTGIIIPELSGARTHSKSYGFQRHCTLDMHFPTLYDHLTTRVVFMHSTFPLHIKRCSQYCPVYLYTYGLDCSSDM